MHLHFAITHNATEFGIAEELRYRNTTVDGGGGSNRVTPRPQLRKENDKPDKVASGTKADPKPADGTQAGDGQQQLSAEQRTKKAAAKQAEAGKQQLANGRVNEALRNGALNENESKYLLNPKNERVQKGLARFSEKLGERGVAETVDLPGDDEYFQGNTATSDRAKQHDDDMEKLMGMLPLDYLKQYGTKDEVKFRKDAEGRVVGVVKDQMRYKGLLRLQQEELKTKAFPEGYTSAGDLKKQVEAEMAEFNKQGDGVFMDNHDGGSFGGEDWEAGEQIDFEGLEDLIGDDKHDRWEFIARNAWEDGKDYGKGDSEKYIGQGEATFTNALNDALKAKAAGDLTQEEFDKVEANLTRANTIVTLYGKYEASKEFEETETDADGNPGYAGIQSQIDQVDASIELERGQLSQANLDAIDTWDDPRYLNKQGQQLHVYAEGDGPTKFSSNPVPIDPATGQPPVDQGGGADETGNGNGNGGGQVDGTPGKPGNGTVQQQQKVILGQAQENGYVPAGTTFNKQGEAVYTVQQGDDYWRIAAASSGTGNPVDEALWRETWATNSAALGRGPVTEYTSQLINQGEPVTIAGRSYAELQVILDQIAKQDDDTN